MNPNPASLDLTSLRLLLAVVEEGNLARAAARENIAVSAVSRRIQNLEMRLGVTLLHRYDRGVQPTPAALLVIDRVRHVLGLLDQVVEDLADVRDGSRGLVRIQAHTTVASGILPDLLARFLADHPDIDVSVDEATSNDILDAIRHGVCDLGLVSGTVEPGELELIPWAFDELLAVLPPGHPLASRTTLNLNLLLRYPFIAMHHDSALVALYRGQARVLGKPMIERAHVTGFATAAKMVGVGLGVTILPASAAKMAADLYGAVWRPLTESWATRPLALCVRDLGRSAGATRSLVEFLKGQSNR